MKPRRGGRLRIFIPAGKIIFRAGDAATSAFVIERGRVDLFRGRGKSRVRLASLGDGEIFGEMALLDQTTRETTAVAAEPTELFIADQELLRSRLDRADPVLELIILALLDRLRETPLTVAARAKSSGTISRRRAISQFETEHALTRAIAENKMVMHFQPIVALADGRVRGLEALARWRSRKNGLLAPSHFVDLAERSRFIRELDLWALGQACGLLRRLDQALAGGAAELFVAVNLSPVHFNDRQVVAEVATVIRSHAVDPRRVKLEITENALIADIVTARAILADFRKLGVGVALDDFGTGYSSLRHLHKLQVDMLKIDKSFVADIGKSRETARLVKAIIALAQTFKLPLTAEGIDARGQLTALAALGVDLGQGYYFSKALPAGAAVAFVRRNLSKPRQRAKPR